MRPFRHVILFGLPTALVAMAACSSSEDEPATVSTLDAALPSETGDATVEVVATDASVEAGEAGITEESAVASRSGSRLRRELWKGGGVDLFQSFVDTERADERCAFERSDDNQLRCLPSNAMAPLFTDATCQETAMVARAPATATDSAMLVRRGNSCNRFFAVFGVGAEVSAPAKVFQRDVDGVCFQTATAPSGSIYRAVTAKLEASAFVRGARQVEAGTTRLRRYGIVSGDGASLAESLFDTTLPDTCYPRTAKDDASYCMAGFLDNAYFYDSVCSTSPVVPDPTCGRQRYAVQFNGPANEPLRVGNGVDAGAYFRAVSDTCLSVGGPGSLDRISSATRIPLAELVKVTTAFTGDGRLQGVVLRGEDGSSAALKWGADPLGVLLDKTLDVLCTTGKLDGSTRCLPQQLTGSRVFADAACTEYVQSISPQLLARTPPARFVRLADAFGVTYHRIGAPRTLLKAYVKNPAGTCVVAGFLPRDAHDLGPAEPATTFVELPTVIE